MQLSCVSVSADDPWHWQLFNSSHQGSAFTICSVSSACPRLLTLLGADKGMTHVLRVPTPVQGFIKL